MKTGIAAVSETVSEKAAGTSVAGPITVGGGVSACTVFGYPLPDLVQIATAIYLLISIVRLCWTWAREIKQARKESMP